MSSADDYILARRLLEREWEAASFVPLPPSALREFLVPARCWVCDGFADLHVDYSYSLVTEAGEVPNWREHLRCTRCLLNNRMRAVVHFLEASFVPMSGGVAPKIYLTEQCTPMFTAMRKRCSRVVGSEYLGDRVALGQETLEGLRNESLTKLTFPDSTFDFVLSLDVIEHVGHVDRALAECHRVLRPGGALIFTVPFYPERRENLVRAVEEDDGSVRHLLPPEYHGDPLSTEGCLAFHHFGWELLDRARDVGFARVEACFLWSRESGYMGGRNSLFVSRKGT